MPEYENAIDKLRDVIAAARGKTDLELGGAHYVSWVADGDDPPKICGGLLYHLTPDGKPCVGHFAWMLTKWEREHPERQYNHTLWTPEGEPGPHMTLSPSLLCSCGDHGFIRDGKWVQA